MCDLVRSPALCRALLAAPAEVLSRYELSARERRRLLAIAEQPGMALTAALHGASRLSPIHALLPRTCLLLGPALAGESERFWAGHEPSDPPFRPEAERFAAYLRGRICDGASLSPFLPEILDFELAMIALRYLPRQTIVDELAAGGDRLWLHPLVRLVRFRHEPTQLLRCLTEMRAPPRDLPTGEHWVLLRAGQTAPDGAPIDEREEAADGLVVERIEPALGRALATLEAGVNAAALGAGEAAALIDARLAVRGRP